MSVRVLLDEMLSERIARQLRDRGHDAASVVTDHELVGLSDEQILAYATGQRRAVVTANIKDFVPLDGQYRERGAEHGGLILVSSRTFPQDRGFVGAVVTALDRFLATAGDQLAGQLRFLERA